MRTSVLFVFVKGTCSYCNGTWYFDYGHQGIPSLLGRESPRKTFGGALSSALRPINGSQIWCWMTGVMPLT